MQTIRSPLGFFALALVIINGFLLAAGTLFNLPLAWKLVVLLVGVLVFVAIVGGVFWLVANKPENLVLGEQATVDLHLIRTFGTEKRLLPTIGDLRQLIPSRAPNIPPGQQQLVAGSPPVRTLEGSGQQQLPPSSPPAKAIDASKEPK